MKKITFLFSLLCISFAFAKAPTSELANTECAGTSTAAQQGTFTAGYNYSFITTGTSVEVTFELLDDKDGVIAYLWQKTPFAESGMTNAGGKKFTKTLTGLTVGSQITYACKFAYAGGLSATKYYTYTVGNNCGAGGGTTDTQAPTNFTASVGAITATSVELLLNGSDDSGAVIYNVSYGAGKTASATANSGTQKSLIITGLTSETAYTFSVTAKDATGNEAANNPIVLNATTSKDMSNECAGTSTAAQQGTFTVGYNYSFTTSGTDVTITFELLDTKTGVNGYLWQQTPFAESTMTNVPGTLKYTKTISGLTVGDQITYACKFSYAGGLSATKYFTYTVGNTCSTGGGTTDTQAPTNFTASLGAITSTSVELLLNGSDDSGSVTYNVSYGAGQTATITGISGTQKSLVINDLTPETAYTFSITAKDETGNMAANNPIALNATTAANTNPGTGTNTECNGTSSETIDGTPLTQGYNYSFTTSGTSVTMTFELLDTKDGLVAYSFRQAPFAETLMTNAGGQKFTQTLTGLTLGSQITYACKFAYAGGMSVTKYFTYTVGNNCGQGGETTDTEAPTNFTATLGNVTATSVELLLNGNDDSGSVTYTVSYGTPNQTATITGVSGTQTSLVINGLTPETAYTFSITAADATGNTATNNPIVLNTTTTVDTNTECAGTSSATIDGTPLTQGYNYSFTTTGTDVTMTFELLDTKDGLVAYSFRQEPFAETLMTNAGGQKFTQTISDATAGSQITYACKFAYAGGMSVTKYFTYTVGNTCSLTNNSNEFSKSVSIYPNPAKNILNIESGYSLSKIEFYSVLGSKVLETTGNTNAVNIETLSKGIYMVKMFTENNDSVIKKLIVE